jgi:hypothetical protein
VRVLGRCPRKRRRLAPRRRYRLSTRAVDTPAADDGQASRLARSLSHVVPSERLGPAEENLASRAERKIRFAWKAMFAGMASLLPSPGQYASAPDGF